MRGWKSVSMNEGNFSEENGMKKTVRNYVTKARLAVIAAAMIGVASQFAFQTNVFGSDKEAKPAPAQVHVDSTPVKRDGRFTTSFAPVVKKVSPSVVKVYITGKAPKEQMME